MRRLLLGFLLTLLLLPLGCQQPVAEEPPAAPTRRDAEAAETAAARKTSDR